MLFLAMGNDLRYCSTNLCSIFIHHIVILCRIEYFPISFSLKNVTIMKIPAMWCAVLFLFVGGCSDSKPDLKAGKWQITAQVVMAGTPFTLAPMVYEECLSQSDIIPKVDEDEPDCQLQGPTVNGNTASWLSVCTDRDGSVAKNKGSITYAGETFSGTLHIDITGSQPMSAENTLSGRYIGNCDQES